MDLTPTPQTERPLVCRRCGRTVPPDRLACDCFILTADREKNRLGVARFLAGEAPLFLKGGHLYPDRRKTLSLCLKEHIDGMKDDWKTVKRVTVREYDPAVVGCEECGRAVEEAADV